MTEEDQAAAIASDQRPMLERPGLVCGEWFSNPGPTTNQTSTAIGHIWSVLRWPIASENCENIEEKQFGGSKRWLLRTWSPHPVHFYVPVSYVGFERC